MDNVKLVRCFKMIGVSDFIGTNIICISEEDSNADVFYINNKYYLYKTRLNVDSISKFVTILVTKILNSDCFINAVVFGHTHVGLNLEDSSKYLLHLYEKEPIGGY